MGNNPANRTDPSGLKASEAAALAAGVGGASAFPVAPQSNVQGTPLGNWIDNSPIHDPPLEGVYREQFLIGGGLGVLRGAAQAAAKGMGSAAAKGSKNYIDAYRAVSKAEADDIATHGFRPHPEGRSMGDKWFSETRQGAEQFRQTYPELQDVVTTRVPRNVYD
ncbi:MULTISPECIES: hypothetical protein [unclassified Variovorax]|uniref:hypothetical protein n=1 Tax=unclassified Variovorax TaxID=663243 RepID=UPI0011AF8DEA|nr:MULTISPECIES: hypothetical protein [unclassified Variovorax]